MPPKTDAAEPNACFPNGDDPKSDREGLSLTGARYYSHVGVQPADLEVEKEPTLLHSRPSSECRNARLEENQCM